MSQTTDRETALRRNVWEKAESLTVLVVALVWCAELRCAALVQLSDSESFLVTQQVSHAATTNICWVRVYVSTCCD